jgi:predicted DCC family thiol-disulfide oxidoreductase YuxK
VSDAAPLLVYDGDCGFCTRAVRFVLERDTRRRTVQFAARDGAAGRAVRARHGLQGVESLLWVETVDGVERAYVYSDAVLAVAMYLGGPYAFIGRAGMLVPRFVRDPMYAAVARVRKSLLRGAPACHLPSPQELARMLP